MSEEIIVWGEPLEPNYKEICSDMRSIIGAQLEVLRQRPWALQAGEITLDELTETGISVTALQLDGGKSVYSFTQTSGELMVRNQDAEGQELADYVAGDDLQGYTALSTLHGAIFALDTASFHAQQRGFSVPELE